MTFYYNGSELNLHIRLSSAATGGNVSYSRVVVLAFLVHAPKIDFICCPHTVGMLFSITNVLNNEDSLGEWI